jgi:hypothetical protein
MKASVQNFITFTYYIYNSEDNMKVNKANPSAFTLVRGRIISPPSLLKEGGRGGGMTSINRDMT